jgi:hypothetical protein
MVIDLTLYGSVSILLESVGKLIPSSFSETLNDISRCTKEYVLPVPLDIRRPKVVAPVNVLESRL